ncbi:methionine-rich protein-like [Haliotis cracherodii]|uniref:methionine-rich protein-like n=1 Tax=Haliotis cracherodii TaxID=6455 RepID=UPI0039E9C1D1
MIKGPDGESQVIPPTDVSRITARKMSFSTFILVAVVSACIVGAQMPGFPSPMVGGMPSGMMGGMPSGMTGGMPGGMMGGMPGGMMGGMPGGMMAGMLGRRRPSFRRSPSYLGAKQLGCSYGIDVESMLRYLLPRGCSPANDFCPFKYPGRRCVQAGPIGMCCPSYVSKGLIHSSANMILMKNMAEMFAL